MGLFELFILAIGLSMDAFSVSVCKGLSVGRVQMKHMLLTGAWFGGFQALMPIIGFLVGVRFQAFITNIDHWIAFVLLALIGGNMLREAFHAEEEEKQTTDSFAPKTMFVMAVATSIDALAVGVTFAFLSVQIVPAALLIGVTTFVCSAVGVKLGGTFGAHYQKKAEIIGGCVLILLGLKILLEHLGVLG